MEYILVLLWVMFAALLGRAGGMQRHERVLGKEARRATWAYAILVMGPIILLTAFRWRYFGDTNMYVRSFTSIPSSLVGKLEYIRGIEKDPGYYGLTVLISCFAGKSYRIYLLIIAVIQGFCLMKTFRKYSEDYWFSMFVFVASTDIFSWMYNGLRQFTAVAIIFAASGWIFNRKYGKAILAILFASLFHRSALMMIPIIFVVQGKPWNWKTLLIMMGTMLIMTSSGTFTGMLDDALENTQYQNVVSDWINWQDDGTNPLRVLVYSVPTILSLLCRKKIQRSEDRVIQVACNMSIISTALYLVSMVTSGLFMGRLPIYCSLYATGILLPWELKHVFGKFVRLMAVLCFMLFFVFQMKFIWGVI